MILYDDVLSPDCYAVRLLASLLGAPLALRPVDVHPGREHRGPELLALNPAGGVPILVDGDLVLTEPAAMLVYLAASQAPAWLGEGGAAAAARVQQGLAFSRRLAATLGAARRHAMLHGPGDIDALQAAGTEALRELEAGLVEQGIRGARFLAADWPTIADVACLPHVALAPDGGVPLDPYPRIRLWSRALRSLDGFVEMPGIHRLHELRPDEERGT